MAKSSGRKTFVVQILNRQNATWQGLITWTEGQQTQSFRSALELIKLIDSALEEENRQDSHPEWNDKKQTP
jgi:hypothetical protein